MAAKWLEMIRYIYANKGMPDDGISHPIVKYTGTMLSKAVREGYGIIEIDFDEYDWGTMQYLQANVWRFSVAKNYNDLLALNNLLVKEDGYLRTWNEFKRVADDVVGRSNRYLKTEYNTVVGASQMAQLWNQIQQEKDIFPTIMFDVIMDGHTSDICAPLHGVIVSVDSPILKRYFPPNHFNCRTTVRQLRYGKPTNTEDIKLPIIPSAFKNNVGQSGVIFTDENKYIENIPKEILELSKLKVPLETKYIAKNGAKVKVSPFADSNDFDSNFKDAKLLADQLKYNMDIRAHLDSRIVLNHKNPEYRVNGALADKKAPKGLKYKNVLRKAAKQNCEYVIINNERNGDSLESIKRKLRNILSNKEVHPTIKKIVIIVDMKAKEFDRNEL